MRILYRNTHNYSSVEDNTFLRTTHVDAPRQHPSEHKGLRRTQLWSQLTFCDARRAECKFSLLLRTRHHRARKSKASPSYLALKPNLTRITTVTTLMQSTLFVRFWVLLQILLTQPTSAHLCDSFLPCPHLFCPHVPCHQYVFILPLQPGPSRVPTRCHFTLRLRVISQLMVSHLVSLWWLIVCSLGA